MTLEQEFHAGHCSQLNMDLRSKYPDDLQAQRDGVVALKQECGGTGVYEVNLGGLERRLGNDAEAMRIYQDHINRKLPNYEHSFVALHAMRFTALTRTDDPDLTRAREMRDELATFAKTHKALGFSDQQAAVESAYLHDWEKVVTHARASIAEESGGWIPRRQLVIALHQLDRCSEALPEIEPAIEHRESLRQDAEFMLAADACRAKPSKH